MPTPNAGQGPTGTLPPGPENPSHADVGAALSVEQTFHDLLVRRAVYVPQRIQSGANLLHGVDLITKRVSR